MLEIIREIDLDVSEENRLAAIVAKQYDSRSRYLLVRLTDRGEPLTLPADASVIISANRPGGDSNGFTGSVRDGRALVPLDYWMLMEQGSVICDLVVTDQNGYRLTTMSFALDVRHSCLGDDFPDDSPSAGGQGLLVQLINDVAELKKKIEEGSGSVSDEQVAAAVEKYLTENPIKSPEAAESAENAKKSAEDAGASAEEAKTAADEAGESARNAGQSATAAGESASRAASSAGTAESYATAAQTAKEGAVNAQQAAETAQTAAEKAATNAAASVGTAGESATAAQKSAQSAASAQEAAEAAKKAAESARDESGRQATAASNAAQTATSKATAATEANSAAQTAKSAAETARDEANQAASNAGNSAIAASGSATNADASKVAAAASETNAAKSATAAAGSATTANNAATAAQTAQGKAETAQKAAEGARDTAAQKATDAANAARTATTAATGATEAKSSAEKAASAASTHAVNAEGAASRAEALAKKVEDGELKGDPGKSAYQHAQEGGFEGTEEAFNAKLATPFPSTLPNPKKLIINGVEYDGSKEVSLQLDDVDLVESLEQMTDTSKYYGIRNAEDKADIWWYVYRKGHTNWLPIAYTLPTNKTPLEGVGYKMNWRVDGSNGNEEEPPAESGFCYLTGYIPVHAGSVVICENIKMNNSTYGCIAAFYNESGAILAGKHIGYSGSYIVDNDYNGITITVPPTYTTAAYIRIQGYYEYKKTPELNTATIVVDEAITDYETGWQWEDSGVDTSFGNDTALLELTKRVTAIEEGGEAVVNGYGLPDYWNDHLDSKIATINGYLADGGRNAFAYVVMTDLHIAEQRASYTGKLACRIMDECKIKNALDLGDHTSRGYINDRATSDAQFDACRELVAPIAEDILPTQGNHDGTMIKSDGTTEYYTPADALNQVYGGMRTDMPIVWDDCGTGYYADDRSHRVRYIVLNTSSRGDFTGDLASNGGYTYFRYTQGQYDLVKEALSTLPNDRWRVVVASHVPPVGTADRFGDGMSVSNLKSRFPDAPEMRKLLAAYVNRMAVSINYIDSAVSYGNANLSADFTNAKGRLIAYHSGHLHTDLLWTIGATCDSDVGDTLAFPILGHRCDSFNENQDSGSTIEATLEAERVVGTITEHSFDVVVVDPDSDTMHLVKIGAGQDRSVSLRR